MARYTVASTGAIVGRNGATLYAADAIADLSDDARERLAELAAEGLDWEESEAVLIAEGLVPPPPRTLTSLEAAQLRQALKDSRARLQALAMRLCDLGGYGLPEDLYGGEHPRVISQIEAAVRLLEGAAS